VELTVGGGGAPQYTPASGQPDIVTYSKSYSFAEFTVSGNTLTAQGYQQLGRHHRYIYRYQVRSTFPSKGRLNKVWESGSPLLPDYSLNFNGCTRFNESRARYLSVAH